VGVLKEAPLAKHHRTISGRHFVVLLSQQIGREAIDAGEAQGAILALIDLRFVRPPDVVELVPSQRARQISVDDLATRVAAAGARRDAASR
jgi:hypothetical protein